MDYVFKNIFNSLHTTNNFEMHLVCLLFYINQHFAVHRLNKLRNVYVVQKYKEEERTIHNEEKYMTPPSHCALKNIEEGLFTLHWTCFKIKICAEQTFFRCKRKTKKAKHQALFTLHWSFRKKEKWIKEIPFFYVLN